MKFGEFHGDMDIRILQPPYERSWWELILPARPSAILLAPFKYVEPNGDIWTAKIGISINGLSSPRFLWRLMPPFAWRGVRASVIHDAACIEKIRSSIDAHWMLYLAMRCDHASPIRAWLTWAMVRIFGPRFVAKT